MIRRIVLLKPCCIGDVIMATPLLVALRRAYPDAVIDWAVGSAAIQALIGLRNDFQDQMPGPLNDLLDTGPLANPASKPGSLFRLINLLRSGRYDLAVVPDRSPLLGLAVFLAGIGARAGLDSAGRGVFYTVKAGIDPSAIRHEAEIYLDVARALGLNVDDCWATAPPSQSAIHEAQEILGENGFGKPLILVHPGGGVNPGMTMIQKRWPAENFAALAARAADHIGGQIGVLGTGSDRPAVETVLANLKPRPVINWSGKLTLPIISALAATAALYIGNDNGVAHLAAASGGRVLMIFGPSDPRRYAPFVPRDRARVAWKAFELPERGVSAGTPADFDWARDGVSVEEAWTEARQLLG